MTPLTRVRQLAPALFVAALVLALGACGGDYPNSTFNHYTDINTATDALWDKLLFWGTVVFIIVEGILLYVVFRFRKRPGAPEPKMVHGNTTLELTWTILPVFILIMIAIPTVKTIFKTQAPAPAGSLEIAVVGHQWWWEFRYPQYGFSTANELYLPAGRPVNFTLTTVDVLHSFWVPQLGGKRDLITNRINHLWYTPNADLQDAVWNGFCTEYCGSSHANMRIHAYTVTPTEFESWAAGQKAPAVFSAPPAAPASKSGGAMLSPGVLAEQTPAAPVAPSQAAPGWFFPAEKLPEYAKPKTPIPAGIEFDDALLARGDAARGLALVNTKGACLSCHMFTTAMFAGQGPNLTHIATRHTIAGGIYPNDARHLARWIKNARRMKPGVIMIALGIAEIDPITKTTPIMGKLTDQEIADIVAYLQALK